MNFLAHALLAGESPADRLGGLIGDFVKGPLPAGLPPALAEGVRLHRKIDVFADTHPAFVRSRSRISPERRRVAGIMVDMFYDHFLTRRWSDFCSQPLEHFTAATYALMQAHEPLLPTRLAAILPRMVETDLFASYRHVDTIEIALDRMSARLTRTDMLLGSGVELRGHYADFERDFARFFPEALAFAEECRQGRLSAPG